MLVFEYKLILFEWQFLFESRSNQSMSQEYLVKENRTKQNAEMKSLSLEPSTNTFQYS